MISNPIYGKIKNVPNHQPVGCVAYDTRNSWSLNSLKLLIVAWFWLWHMIVRYICLKLQSSGNHCITGGFPKFGYTPKHPSHWTILLLKQPCMVTWGPHEEEKPIDFVWAIPGDWVLQQLVTPGLKNFIIPSKMFSCNSGWPLRGATQKLGLVRATKPVRTHGENPPKPTNNL